MTAFGSAATIPSATPVRTYCFPSLHAYNASTVEASCPCQWALVPRSSVHEAVVAWTMLIVRHGWVAVLPIPHLGRLPGTWGDDTAASHACQSARLSTAPIKCTAPSSLDTG